MNESTFAAMRIVAIMMGADGKVHQQEIDWFMQLIGHYGVTATQREILRENFNGGDVAECYREIDSSHDRLRLLNWLKIMMQLDREIHPKEKEIFDQVKALDEEIATAHLSSHAGYAKAYLESEKEVKLWMDLKESADFFSHRLTWFGTTGHFGKPVPNNRFVWIFVIFNVLLAFALAVLHFF